MKKQQPKLSVKQLAKLIIIFITMQLIGISSPHLHSAFLQSKVGNQTVYIRSPEGAEHQGSATGFEIKVPSGHVFTLTNAHVCGLQKDGLVLIGTGPSSEYLIPKRVLKISRDSDLCLVEGLEGYSGLSMASSYDIGDLNYVIGYALGDEQNLSQGYLKSKAIIQIPEMEIDSAKCNGPYQQVVKVETFFGPMDVCMIKRYAIATNISIYPGNSGSAMVNAFGNVTGIVFAGNLSTFWGYAVSLEDVNAFLRDL